MERRKKKEIIRSLQKAAWIISLLCLAFLFSCTNPGNSIDPNNPELILKSGKRLSAPVVEDALSGDPVIDASMELEQLGDEVRLHVRAKGYIDAYSWFSNKGDRLPSSIVLSPKSKKPYQDAAWKNTKGPKLILLQFDGMTQELFEKGLDRGDLPAMEVLLEKGTWGRLKSCCNYISAAVWTSIDTGLLPEESGIKGFLVNAPNSGEPIAVTSDHIKAPRLWNLVRATGQKALVGGILFPDPQDDFLHGISDLSIKRTRTKNAVKKYDPALLVVYEKRVDDTGHFFWKDYEPEPFRALGWDIPDRQVAFNKERLPQTYRDLNAWVALALQLAGSDTVIFALSDHGFAGTTRAPLTVSAERFAQHLQISAITDCDTDKPGELMLCAEKSFNPSLTAALLKKAYLSDGSPALLEVKHRGMKDFDNGGSDAVAFRLVLNLEALAKASRKNESLIIGDRKISVRDFCDYGKEAISGDHDKFGLYLIAGKNIQKGGNINEPQVLDAMKTNLAILGLPIAQDMAGRVWIEAFKEAPTFQTIPTYGREERKKAMLKASPEQLGQLRSLGYIN